MKTVTVKNIPDEVYECLQRSADINRRSVNSEIIVCIERQVSSQRRDVDDIVQRARALRSLTSATPVTQNWFDEAKREGRP